MRIKRLCFNKLWSEIAEPFVSILLGARQVGKSTLLRQLEEEAKKTSFSTEFYDLEQPSDLNRLSGTEQDVIQELTSSARIIFIDEFHYLKNASKIFKAVYDSGKPIKIYASGSSSLEIHKHLKESLAGRFMKTMIYPLSLKEWEQSPNFLNDEYLQWGGMPALIHKPEPNDRAGLLENIVGTYITKDIKGLIKEENIRAFNSLLYLLAQSQGSVAVASNLARETGLSESTVARHLEIISQTYVLYVAASYSGNMANELKKSKKYYLFDLGIRNLLLKDFRAVSEREDKGVLYETAVFLQMVTQLKPNMEIRFWRTKKGDEVDFIILKNRIPIPVEVKSNLTKPDVPKGLIQFLKRYPKAPFGVVFNAFLEDEITVEGRQIIFKLWNQAGELSFLKSVL
ncbi:MAG: ATP-binding protein [Candidatus Omnitrophota bacterium]